MGMVVGSTAIALLVAVAYPPPVRGGGATADYWDAHRRAARARRLRS